MTTHDTAAALEAAIDKYTAAAIANAGALGAPDEHAAAVAAWAVVESAITAHVEAEVARRLAAAPDVEQQIDLLRRTAYGATITGVSVGGMRETIDRLRAAIAAEKARVVEAAEDAAFIRGRDAVRKHPEGWGLVARPTPDKARRLVDALVQACQALADDKEYDTARTALLRVLGVEA